MDASRETVPEQDYQRFEVTRLRNVVQAVFKHARSTGLDAPGVPRPRFYLDFFVAGVLDRHARPAIDA